MGDFFFIMSRSSEHGNRAAVTRMFRHGVGADNFPTTRTIRGVLTGEEPIDELVPAQRINVDSPPPPDPLGIVTLGMYSPRERAKITGLINHYVGEHNLTILAELSSNGKFRRHEARRRTEYLSRHPNVSQEEYDLHREEQLESMRERTKRRINYQVYRTVQDSLGLESLEQAAEVFEKQRRNANQAVIDHVALVYPGEMRTGLRNEVSFTRRPADLLEQALQSGTDPELQFEIRRLFLNTVIALHERKGRSTIADEKLAQIQNLLNEKFYAGKTGKNHTIEIYGMFDNETNALIGEPLFEPPTDQADEGTHYKTLQLPVRQLKSGTFVLTLVDQKYEGNAIRKALRKAQERKAKGKGDTVSVEDDVQDTYRMKIVVIGDQGATDDVTSEIFELLTDKDNNPYFYNRDIMGKVILDDMKQPTGIPTGDGEIQMGNRGGTGQSDNVNYTKIAVEFQQVVNPIKIVVQPLASYIAEELEVGKYDNEIGEYDGAAHSLYRERREKGIKVFFPLQIYPELPDLNQRDRRVPSPTSRRIATQLRETKVFSRG